MRLISFDDGRGIGVGVTDGENFAAVRDVTGIGDIDMIALIDGWEAYRSTLIAIEHFPRDLNSVRLLAPVPRPGKIFGIGLNYADHVAEAGMSLPDEQIWFTKAVTAVNGPFASIERPMASAALDYEAELVAVIGQRCRHVDKAAATDMIFGYCVGNDVSVRDWQMRTTQFVLGKSFDTHAPFGPWIETADGFDASALPIRSFVNGELRQNSNTKHLVFDCAAQIAHLSQAMTLEPGDILFTGTPGGVGAAMSPPQWLKQGDVVRVEIDGIGAIENIVADETP